MECTYRLSETLRQVGEVKVGRTLITLGLKASIETLLRIANLELVSTIIVRRRLTHSRKTHFVSQAVEAADALFRVTDVRELGKAEP